MKIARVSVFQLDLPLSKPYWLSGGRLKFERLDATFVRVETDDGRVGWGEGTPWGVTYLPAHGRGIRAALDELAPEVLGLDPRQVDRVNERMDRALPGHLYAKAPLDVACWDLLAQSAGLSLCEALGARHPDPVPIASSVSTGSPEDMLAEVQRFRTSGYRVHSAKIGADVHLDIDRITLLAESEQPGETIFYDVNRAWLPRQAVSVLANIPPVTSWFEQPCETLDQIAHVRRMVSAALGVDESIHTFDDLARVAREGIAEVVNIKINRVGGITKARRLRDHCLASGLTMLIMDTGGTVLADTAVAHLAQTIPGAFCAGVWSCQEMITIDPAPGRGVRNVDGCFTAPDGPGLGVAPDVDRLGRPVAEYG